MTTKSDVPYLQHILDAISDIEESTQGISKEHFIINKDIKDANVRRLEIIGEAVKHISKEFRDAHPEIEWNEIVGMRDTMIHKYFGVNLDIVWDTIREDLPDLKKKLQKIAKTL